jgi:hypothetical protein
MSLRASCNVAPRFKSKLTKIEGKWGSRSEFTKHLKHALFDGFLSLSHDQQCLTINRCNFSFRHALSCMSEKLPAGSKKLPAGCDFATTNPAGGFFLLCGEMG